MAAGLTSYLLAGSDGEARPASLHRHSAAASSGDDLVLHDMKADESRRALRLEVTAHGVLHHGLQFVQGVGLSVD